MKISHFVAVALLVIIVIVGASYLRSSSDDCYILSAGDYYFVDFDNDGNYTVEAGDVELRLYEYNNKLQIFTEYYSQTGEEICAAENISYDMPLLITDYIAFPNQLKIGAKSSQFIGFRYYWYVLTGRRHEYEAEKDLYYTPFTYCTILVDYTIFEDNVKSQTYSSYVAEFLSSFKVWFDRINIFGY